MTLTVAALAAAAAAAQEDPQASVIGPIDGPKAAVMDGLSFFRDQSLQLTARELTRPIAQSAFKPFAGSRFHAEERPGAYWFKFRIAAAPDRDFDYFLLFSQPNVAGYSLYEETIPGSFKERAFIRAAGLRDVDVLRGAIGHEVKVEAGESRAFFVRVVAGELNGGLMLWDKAAWQAEMERRNWMAYTAIGIALAASLLALLARWLRGAGGALWGGVYGLAAAVSIIGLSGFFYELPILWRFADDVEWIAFGLPVAAFAQFMAVLAGRNGAPRWLGVALRGLGFGALGAAGTGPFLGVEALYALEAIAAAILLLSLMGAALLNGQRLAARIWLVAICLPLIAGAGYLAGQFFAMPPAESAAAGLLLNAALLSVILTAIAAWISPKAFAAAPAANGAEVSGQGDAREAKPAPAKPMPAKKANAPLSAKDRLALFEADAPPETQAETAQIQADGGGEAEGEDEFTPEAEAKIEMEAAISISDTSAARMDASASALEPIAPSVSDGGRKEPSFSILQEKAKEEDEPRHEGQTAWSVPDDASGPERAAGLRAGAGSDGGNGGDGYAAPDADETMEDAAAEPSPTSPANLIQALENRIDHLNRALKQRDAEIAVLRGNREPGRGLDMLTGVPARAAFKDDARAALAHARRYGRAATLMLIEVEDYELIREQLGQPVCDKAVKLLAVSCTKSLRDADILGRYDEKTFIAIMPETDAIGASHVAQRLSQTLAERTLPTPKGMLQLAATVAYTEFGEKDEAVEDMIARAQQVLAEDRPFAGPERSVV